MVNEAKIIISAEDNATQTLNRIQNNFESAGASIVSMGQSLKNVGTLMSTFAAPFIAGMGIALKTGIDFEQQMKNVQAIMGGTTEDFELLTDKAREMGRTTAKSASESAQAMVELARAGFNTQQIIDSLGGVLNFAIAGDISLADASNIVAGAINAFGMRASESQKIVDIFSKTVNSSAQNTYEFAEAFRNIAPGARSLGISIEETAATIGVLANNFLTGSRATTALATSFTRLAKPTAEAQVVMDELNLSFFDASGTFIGIANTVDMLNTSMAGLTDEQRKAALASIFGAEALKQWEALLNSGATAISGFEEELKNAGGTSEDLANVKLDSVAGMLTLIKSELEDIQIGIFDDMQVEIKDLLKIIKEGLPGLKYFTELFIEGFLDALNAIKPVAGDIVDFFSSIDKDIQKTIVTTAGFGTVVAAVGGPALIIIGSLVSQFGALVGAIGGLGISASALTGIVTSLGGVGLAVGGVSLAAETFKNAWDENFNDIQGTTTKLESDFNDLVTNISLGMTDISSSFSSAFLQLSEDDTLKTFITDSIESLDDLIVKLNEASVAVYDYKESIDFSAYEDDINYLLVLNDKSIQAQQILNNAAKAAFQSLVSLVGAGALEVSKAYESNFLDIRGFTEYIMQSFIDLGGLIVKTFELMLDTIIYFGNNWDDINEGLLSSTTDTWDKINSFINWNINDIISGLNDLIGVYNTIAGVVPGIEKLEAIPLKTYTPTPITAPIATLTEGIAQQPASVVINADFTGATVRSDEDLQAIYDRLDELGAILTDSPNKVTADVRTTKYRQ